MAVANGEAALAESTGPIPVENVIALPLVGGSEALKTEPRQEPEAKEAEAAPPEAPVAAAAMAMEMAAHGFEARINEEDAEFHRAHLSGLALSWSNLWIGLVVMAAAAAALWTAVSEPLAGLAAGLALGALVYAFIGSVVGLRIGFEHERKIQQILRKARLGAERMRIDDPGLVRDALRDVLTEWMHSTLLLRKLRETSFWYRGAVLTQIAVALALIAGFAAVSPLPLEATALVAGAAALLTVIHSRRELRASRERADACELGERLNPTETLADRVEILLEEVRTLRRHGRDI